MAIKPGLLDAGRVYRQLAQPSPTMEVINDGTMSAVKADKIKEDKRLQVHIRYEAPRRRGAGSSTLAVEIPAAPANTGAPAITGTAQENQTLTVSSNGFWSGSFPINYTYQWKRGATNIGTGLTTYTTVTADIGFNITCVVTATNTIGSANATSNSIGPITAASVTPSGAHPTYFILGF